MNLGERIKDLISDRDEKQKELATEISVHPGTLSGYLTNKHQMPFDILVRIAEYLHVTTDYLLGCTDIPEVPLRLSNSERRMILDVRTLNPNQKEIAAKIIQLMADQNQR